jgi:NAD-dependent dihydropyrimidine dehydrogenase PreA subunit
MAETPSPTDCKGAPGRVVPVIDRNRCEAKADCVRVCPYGVFSIQALTAEDRATLSLRGRLKAFFHGGKQAYTPTADQCHACGLCASACPEGAIRLVASRP